MAGLNLFFSNTTNLYILNSTHTIYNIQEYTLWIQIGIKATESLHILFWTGENIKTKNVINLCSIYRIFFFSSFFSHLFVPFILVSINKPEKARFSSFDENLNLKSMTRRMNTIFD